MLDETKTGSREMIDAVVEKIAQDDSFCGGLGPELLIWLDISCPAADWRAGDLVLVESAAVPPLRQVARVERSIARETSHRPASENVGKGSAVCISRLLALTVGARIGTTVRVSIAAVHRAVSSPAKPALAVHFMAAIDLREDDSDTKLAATAHASWRGSSHTTFFDTPRMSDVLAMMLKGSVIIPGQAIAVDWLNKPQLVVAAAVSTDGRTETVEDMACVQTTAAIIDDSTNVSFEHADGIARRSMGLSGIEAWLQLPESVPPKLEEWQSRVLKQVGGLQGQVSRLLGRLHAVLADAEGDARARQSSQGHCVFIHGDSGCGKTHLIESALCCAPGVTICRLDGGQVLQPTLEESVAQVVRTFRAARRQQPSVVLIEELDALGGVDSAASFGIGNARGAVGIAQARVIARLNHEMDRLANGPACAVAVIGTSSRPEKVATTLRRAGRFEVEIKISPLLPLQRNEILRLLTAHFRIGTGECGQGCDKQAHMRTQEEEPDGAGAGEGTVQQQGLIARLADLAVGYVAADLANLTREAALRAMAESTASKAHQQPSCAADTDTSVAVAWKHFEAALVATRPSGLQRLQRSGAGGSSCASNVTSRNDFQSLESLAETVTSEAVRQLTTAIMLPLSSTGRAAFQATNLRPSRGAILYGPAGNGKTLLAAALGRSCTAAGNAAAGKDSNFNWIEVHAAELISAVSGESEKNVSALFAKARSAAPSILFIDELEILAPSRGRCGGHSSSSLNTLERVLSVFLTQLDGVVDTGATAAAASAPVVIIGATRDISAVDPAILRSGRIDTHIHIGPPDMRARAAIIRLRCSEMAGTMDALDPTEIERLVDATEGFSRAEVDSVCREAAMQALREDIGATQVRPEHFRTALEGLSK